MLTNRKQQFINNYILTLNATKSAELAHYSPKTAYSQGSRLLKDVEVGRIITERLEEIKRKNQISKETVLENLWKEANHAQRSSDRITALVAVAKINNYIRDNNIQQTVVNVNDVIGDLKKPNSIDVNSVSV